MEISVNWTYLDNNGGYSALVNNTLDFGSVQAGTPTPIKVVKGTITASGGSATLDGFQFWLASDNGFTVENGWYFLGCPLNGDLGTQAALGLTSQAISSATLPQRLIASSGGTSASSPLVSSGGSKIVMSKMASSASDGTISGWNAITITDGGSATTNPILLCVNTPASAPSGQKNGWYYRMNFLYS